MKIKINGEDYTHPDEDCTLLRVLIIYLSREDIEQIRGIAVAMNGALILKTDWRNTFVEEGDELEVLTATQGG
jgi:thiamine biosynthesis protein ThiS